MNQEESQLRTEEVHLRDYIHVINKRRTLVVAVFAVIFVLVVLYTFSRTPLYRGTTKVLIEKATSEKLTGNSVSRIYDPEFYETQFQLIKSRAVAKRVVTSLDLADNFDRMRGGDAEEGMLSSIFGWFGSVKGLVKGLIGDSQPVGEELAGGKRGRVRFLYDDGGTLHDNGDDWPAEAHDYQFVAITYQFDTRMSRPKP